MKRSPSQFTNVLFVLSLVAAAVAMPATPLSAAVITNTYILGPQGSGKTIEPGIGGLITWIPKGVLPAGSILKSVSVNARLDATILDSWASDICAYLDPLPGAPGTAALLQVGGYGKIGTVVNVLDFENGKGWVNGQSSDIGTTVIDTKIAVTNFPDGIDLNTVRLSIGNDYMQGTWSGTITVTYAAPPAFMGLAWTGADATSPTQWSTSPTVLNWIKDGTSIVAYTQTPAQPVMFDNSVGAGSKIVNISVADVAPASVTFSNNTTGAATYTLTGTHGITGATGLTKNGDGTLIVGNANTYTGPTTLTAGTLKLANSLALQNSTVNHGSASGLIKFDAAITSATFGGLTGNQGLVLENTDVVPAPVALSVGQNNTETEYLGNISGSGSLIKVGSGRLTLNTNSYTGDTTLTDGILRTRTANSLGTGKIIFQGGTLQYIGHNSDVSGRINPIASGKVAKIDTDVQNVIFGTVNGLSGDGGLSKLGTGTLTLNAANNYTGGTTLNAGNLQIAALDRLGSGNITFQGGTLQYGTGSSFDVSGRINNVAIGQAAKIDTNTNDVIFGTGIGGEGGLTKLGDGILTLDVANTYTGGTTLIGGAVRIAALDRLGALSESIPSSGKVTFQGGTLQNATGSTIDVSGRINNVASGQAAKIDTNGNDVSFGTAIGGSGGLSKYGAGTLTLAVN